MIANLVENDERGDSKHGCDFFNFFIANFVTTKPALNEASGCQELRGKGSAALLSVSLCR